MINVVHVLSSLIRATKVELLNGMEINKSLIPQHYYKYNFLSS